MLDIVPLKAVDYLVVGHVTQDVTKAGPRLGGTAAFSALTARALGLRVGVVTSANEEASMKALEGIQVICIPSEHTTIFENIYGSRDGRTQILHQRAAPIPFDLVPEIWQSASIIHLGPVAQELDSQLPDDLCPPLLGITPQGWMRTWNEDGKVVPCKWQSADGLLSKATAVVMSREDVSGDEELIEAMAHQTKILAVTEADAGAVLYWNGDRRRFRAPEVEEVDGTGAGDIFASAFFVRLHQTRDPWEAARFATQLSARSVTRSGLEGIPTNREIDECLMEVF
ncbi:MAG TPA: PfkB family carbohydrate kinase [Anaerolineales bacterium]|nr:PfkB family carbohydrate kinase [Anaerolineales bacterium]